MDLKMSSDSASVISSGRAFHSGMVRGSLAYYNWCRPVHSSSSYLRNCNTIPSGN